MRLLLVALAFIFLMTGCAPAHLQPVMSENFAFELDEKRLWLRSAEEEKVLDESTLIYKDEALAAYLEGIAARLQPPEVQKAIPFRIRVIKNPHLNAFAFANGAIYIHTGILAEMENEAQLATLLAHEMAHCTHRHMLRETRNIKNKTAFMATMQAVLIAFGGVGDLASLLGQLGTMAAIAGYSREMETEADMEGLKRLISAGYDPSESPKLFVHIKREIEEEKIKEPFFYGSHPRIQERIENYEVFLKTGYADRQDGIENADVFLRKVQPVIIENVRLNLKAGRFHTARRQIDKYLTMRPDDPKAHFLLGETFRQSGAADDLETAKGHYRKAIALDPAYADPQRALGLIAYKQKDTRLAKELFESYLSLAPRAADRGYIEEMLKNLR